MVEYFCGRCGKSFYQKSHADAHQRRKKPCSKPVVVAETDRPLDSQPSGSTESRTNLSSKKVPESYDGNIAHTPSSQALGT
jgi:DNA-directed RNA polymerase subunit RPC12/RpoP